MKDEEEAYGAILYIGFVDLFRRIWKIISNIVLSTSTGISCHEHVYLNECS